MYWNDAIEGYYNSIVGWIVTLDVLKSRLFSGSFFSSAVE